MFDKFKREEMTIEIIPILYATSFPALTTVIGYHLSKIYNWLKEDNLRLEKEIQRLHSEVLYYQQLKADVYNPDGSYQSKFIPELDSLLNVNGITKKEA